MRLHTQPCNALPTDIKLHQVSRILEIHFDDSHVFMLPCEYLRVYTPSAEALGHAPGQEILQTGKEDVTIREIHPVGNYGICPVFSDGHNSGIYTWDLLYKLGAEYDSLWASYLERLAAAGHPRREPQQLQ
ncbi:MAG: gamma-butyrobetaine hydroxylase-like domain-containing protein [Gammaproteobacteria bacterium]